MDVGLFCKSNALACSSKDSMARDNLSVGPMFFPEKKSVDLCKVLTCFCSAKFSNNLDLVSTKKGFFIRNPLRKLRFFENFKKESIFIFCKNVGESLFNFTNISGKGLFCNFEDRPFLLSEFLCKSGNGAEFSFCKNRAFFFNS